MITEDKKEKLILIKKKIDMANKWRLAFLFIAVVVLVFIYFGDKFFEGVPLYESISTVAMYIAGWDVCFMLMATFVKLGYTVKYNNNVKNR